MRTNAVQIAFAILTLVVGTVVEDLSPNVFGVGFPVLLSTVQFVSSRRRVLPVVFYVLAAGAAEDAISDLPAMTSASYFLAVAALCRWCSLPRGVSVLTYPVYQIWLWMWVPDLCGNVFRRCLVAAPVGLVTAIVVEAALLACERGGALNEAE